MSAPPAGATAAGAPPLPGSLAANPRLSQWLRFSPDGSVDVFSGKVELGQGILTALAQIVADELGIGLERVRMVAASTARSPNEAVTSGSLSVQDSGVALRYACAEARAIYLGVTAQRLGVPADTLRIDDGVISGSGNVSTSYWELADDALLAREATAGVAPKAASARRIAGTAAARIDIPDKVFGRPRFIHDLVLPGMLHGRVLRQRSPSAKLLALDQSCLSHMSALVTVVRDGDFVGVVAETETAATAAVARLAGAATWSETQSLPDETQLRDWLKQQPADTCVADVRGAPAPAVAVRTVRHAYAKPYIAHASIAPSCAIAQWSEDGVHLWTHSQGVYNLRLDLAIALSMPAESIVVEHAEGAGCYGHNGADDVALDAALLARAVEVGRPVRVQWSRADELSWAPFGPAMAVAIEADLDAGGEILAWRHDVWSNGHTMRPGRAKTPALLAAWHLERPFDRMLPIDPPLAGGGGSLRNAVPPYDFPSWEVTGHRLLEMPLRVSALRSLGAFANVFAIERPEGPGRGRRRVGAGGMGGVAEEGQSRPRHRLRALQEHGRLLRGGRRGRRRSRGAR